nr:DNA ligase 1-like [Setaria viridis]
MYNRLNKIINKIRSLGSDKWGKREVVDKILSAYMATDVQLPILIRENRGFKKFTPAYMIGRIVEHLITVKESKLSQEMSKIHEQVEKNNGVALKASRKNKEKEASTSSKATIKKDTDDSDSKNLSDDDNDVDSDDEKVLIGLSKRASERIMKLMMEIEDRDETLEVQEELFIEREKTIALENTLENEKKGFKVQEDLLKNKIDTILSLEKSLAKEKMKVEELTKELSLAKDTSASLKNENVVLQEKLTSLEANHMALEAQLNILNKSTSSNSNDASMYSSASTSNGCVRCYNVDINACATNIAKMHARKKEIARLSNSLLNKEKNTSKRGEFENHTKGFRSSYMKKFGFKD